MVWFGMVWYGMGLVQSAKRLTRSQPALNSLYFARRRRVLNLLQAASMGNDGTSGKKLGEDEIYLTSGAPLPRDLKELFTVLWNKGFNEAVTFATDMSVLKGELRANQNKLNKS